MATPVHIGKPGSRKAWGARSCLPADERLSTTRTILIIRTSTQPTTGIRWDMEDPRPAMRELKDMIRATLPAEARMEDEASDAG